MEKVIIREIKIYFKDREKPILLSFNPGVNDLSLVDPYDKQVISDSILRIFGYSRYIREKLYYENPVISILGVVEVYHKRYLVKLSFMHEFQRYSWDITCDGAPVSMDKLYFRDIRCSREEVKALYYTPTKVDYNNVFRKYYFRCDNFTRSELSEGTAGYSSTSLFRDMVTRYHYDSLPFIKDRVKKLEFYFKLISFWDELNGYKDENYAYLPVIIPGIPRETIPEDLISNHQVFVL